MVAQIEFAEWTPDAHLRQSAFVGSVATKTRVRLCGRTNAKELWHIATYNLTVFLSALFAPLSLIFSLSSRYIIGKSVAG